MSGDAEQDYFSDGITEDITTELSRYDELFVIARNSTAEFKVEKPEVRSIARELGVGHVLAGSVRRAGNRIRISAQLIDAESGRHIRADRFDRDMEDIFAVQDEITAVIVNVLQQSCVFTYCWIGRNRSLSSISGPSTDFLKCLTERIVAIELIEVLVPGASLAFGPRSLSRTMYGCDREEFLILVNSPLSSSASPLSTSCHIHPLAVH